MSGSWITSERRQSIHERDGRACLYCGSHESELESKLELDHIVARHNGGNNKSENLVTSCKTCNASKGKRSMRSFYAALRMRGIDTKAVSRRVSRQRRKPVDLTLGKAIVAARKTAA